MPVGIGNELQLLSLEGILGHVQVAVFDMNGLANRRFCRNVLKATCVLLETIFADPMTG